MRKSIGIALTASLSLAFGGVAGVAQADTSGPITFEAPTYTTASVNGQNGWMSTGAYDQAVSASTRFADFGAQSLRISNAVTSGAFGDQTFSPALAAPAGESTTQKHFDATFKIGTTQDAVQPDLHMSVSPDNGTGARMSYLRFEDQTDGLHVFFDDVTDMGPFYKLANFNETDIATLDRTTAHTTRFSMDFVAGPANDVVKVYIDGALKATGTTWEDYYRFDNENQGSVQPAPVDRLEFRESGSAAPATQGQGFLIDGLTVASSVSGAAACEFTTSGTKMTLKSDCTTDHTISVPTGFTLDGAGKTITAVDPAGDHFKGAVVRNGGTVANVTNVKITASGLSDVCDAGNDRLRGILLDNASGLINNVDVHGVRQGASGCQEGNAIEARNFEATPKMRLVSVTNSIVRDYQKNGITVNGSVSGIVLGNTVTGAGPISYIAQNGIQVGFGGSAAILGNTVSAHNYTPIGDEACGLLFFEAKAVTQQKNKLFANEVNICDDGLGRR